VETQKFYLLHLTIFREYLECEFSSLKNNLSFGFDFERVIDDFILFAYFVGNDFLPNLPNMHIGDDALGLMYNLYKQILPQLGKLSE
jgi:5'-3' exoribonuclease 1